MEDERERVSGRAGESRHSTSCKHAELVDREKGRERGIEEFARFTGVRVCVCISKLYSHAK